MDQENEGNGMNVDVPNENAEGDAHMEDRGDGVLHERADDQGHGDTGAPTTAWNDPPPVTPRPQSGLPRRVLTRRIPFLMDSLASVPQTTSTSTPPGFTEADINLMEIITTLNTMLRNSCLVRQIGKFQEYWASAICTAEMKDTVLKMTRHIYKRQFREAEMLHAILALNPAAGWFTLYFRQIISLIRDGISAEPRNE